MANAYAQAHPCERHGVQTQTPLRRRRCRRREPVPLSVCASADCNCGNYECAVLTISSLAFYIMHIISSTNRTPVSPPGCHTFQCARVRAPREGYTILRNACTRALRRSTTDRTSGHLLVGWVVRVVITASAAMTDGSAGGGECVSLLIDWFVVVGHFPCN